MGNYLIWWLFGAHYFIKASRESMPERWKPIKIWFREFASSLIEANVEKWTDAVVHKRWESAVNGGASNFLISAFDIWKEVGDLVWNSSDVQCLFLFSCGWQHNNEGTKFLSFLPEMKNSRRSHSPETFLCFFLRRNLAESSAIYITTNVYWLEVWSNLTYISISLRWWISF